MRPPKRPAKPAAQIRPDLQSIGIKGALIGGLVGLALRQISLWNAQRERIR